MGRRKIEENYLLPKDVYMSTLWRIKGYRRLCEEYEDILQSSPAFSLDGMPHNPNDAGDNPMFLKVVMLVDISKQKEPIEKALLKIPPEYQQGIFRNIVDGTPYPNMAGICTWKRWRQRYIYYVAVLQGFKK